MKQIAVLTILVCVCCFQALAIVDEKVSTETETEYNGQCYGDSEEEVLKLFNN